MNRPRAMDVLVAALLLLRFVTELALIAAAAWAAAARPRPALLAVALGVVAALAVAGVWGAWISPASRRRLPDPARLVLEIVLFAAAAAGLVLVGRPVPGFLIGGVGVATAVAVRLLPAGAVPPPRRAAAPPPPPDEVTGGTEAPVPRVRPRGRDRGRLSR